MDRQITCQLSSELQQRGLCARFDPTMPVVRIGDATTVVIIVVPYSNEGKTGRAGWWLHFDHVARADLMLIARTVRSNTEMLDYHLLPFPVLRGPSFRFPHDNMPALARYRLNSMANFWNVFNDCFVRPWSHLCGKLAG
jgi:hypothetical protein